MPIPEVWQRLGMAEVGVALTASDDRLELWLPTPEAVEDPSTGLGEWVASSVASHGLVPRPAPPSSAEHPAPLLRLVDDHQWIDVSTGISTRSGTHVLLLTRSPRPAPRPAAEPGAAWALTLQPGLERLSAGELACVRRDGTAHVFYPDGHYERHYLDRAEVLRYQRSQYGFTIEAPAGSAAMVDPTPCLSPQWAADPQGQGALLCAHRRWDCGAGLSSSPTVLVQDAGGGPDATARVAAVLGRELAAGQTAPVFDGGAGAGGAGVELMVGSPLDPNERTAPRLTSQVRALAEAIDRDLVVDSLVIGDWKGAPAPIVVRVSGGVALRSR